MFTREYVDFETSFGSAKQMSFKKHNVLEMSVCIGEGNEVGGRLVSMVS